MSKILLIDNYDSFTYNLYHYLEEIVGEGIEVMRNDEIDFNKVDDFDFIVISPGPGLPKDAGELMRLLDKYAQRKKILGICLGHQAISQHFGVELINLGEVIHGQATLINILRADSIFSSLPKSFNVGRYHSWVVDKSQAHKQFIVTAVDEQNEVMAIRHKTLAIEAVQFHPESILTEFGKEMLRNWIKLNP